LYRDTILALVCAVYAGGGFGQQFIADAAWVVAILMLLTRTSTRKCDTVIVVIFLGWCLLQPAIMQASPLFAAVLVYVNRPKHAVLVLVGSALQLLPGFNPFFIPLALFPLAIIASLNRWVPSQRLTFAAAAGLLLLNISPTLLPQEAPVGHQSFEYPYRIDIAKRLVGGIKTNTYTSIDDHGAPNDATILVLEHDPPHGLATHNWTQNRLWSENYYFGAPLLRIATRLDGFLYANLGCRVDKPSIRLLGEAHRTEFNSFISKKSGKLVFSDSDFLNNGAVGYQQHLHDALFKPFSIAHVILFGSASALVLALFSRTRKAVPLIVLGILITVSAHERYRQIDIRISADQALWPHSKGVAGIGSEITEETGIKTVSRSGKATILGVSRDGKATHRDEKVIVMEGNSTVTVGGITFEALDLPMGESDGIIDAIPIQKVGSTDPRKCLLKIGNVTLIGTNSARLNSTLIYEAAN